MTLFIMRRIKGSHSFILTQFTAGIKLQTCCNLAQKNILFNLSMANPLLVMNVPKFPFVYLRIISALCYLYVVYFTVCTPFYT